MIRHLTPNEARSQSGTFVDVREFPEYATGAIPGSHLIPLASIKGALESWNKEAAIILICRSGRRAEDAASRLQNMGFTDISVVNGGIEAWRSCGLPLQKAAKHPWSLERQVRAIAGGMVFASALLGLTISPWFFAWTLFVGAGLTFAGISDICLMATLLGKMPWNRPSMKV